MYKIAFALTLAFSAVLFTASASATVISFSETFADGGTAIGSFDYDGATGTVTAQSVTTTAGSGYAASVYDQIYNVTTDPFLPSGFSLDVLTLSNSLNSQLLNLAFNPTIDPGDTIGLFDPCVFCSYEGDPGNPGLDFRLFSTVPEPATAALLGIGLAGFAASRRRNH